MNPPQDRTDYNPPNSLDKRALVGGPVNAVDIDAAMAAANAPGNAVVGTDNQDVPTNRTPTVPGARQLQLGVDAPVYGWNPGQEGFGQGQVNQIQVDGFNTPVATKNFGYGAIAARQQGIAERKQQLADAKSKLMQGYDPFKGISDAGDPYIVAQNNYIQSDYGRLRSEIAEQRFAGDTAEADRFFATDPEGQGILRQWSRTQDSLAKENKGIYKRTLDTLADLETGKVEMDAEDRNALIRFANGVDDNGAPVVGNDPQELLNYQRDAAAAISKAQYQTQFLGDFATFGQQMPTSVSFSRPKGAGGKVVMEVRDEKIFDDFIAAHAQNAVDLGMFKGDLTAAKEWLGKLIKKQYDVKVSVFDPYESVERKAAASAKGQARQSSGWGYAERSFMADERVPGSKDPKAQFEFIAAPNETQSGGAQVISPKPTKLFDPNTPQGAMVMITGFSKPASGGDWLVLGERVDSKIIDEFNQWRQSKGLGPVSAGDLESPETSAVFETWTQNFKTTKGRPYQARLSNNRSQIAAKYGTADPYGFTEVPQAVAAYNKKYGVQMTTEDFGSLTRAQQEAIVNGKY